MDKSGHFDPCIRRQACLPSNFKTCLASSGPKAKGYEFHRSLALLPALVFTTMAHSFRLHGEKDVVEPPLGKGGKQIVSSCMEIQPLDLNGVLCSRLLCCRWPGSPSRFKAWIAPADFWCIQNVVWGWVGVNSTSPHLDSGGV